MQPVKKQKASAISGIRRCVKVPRPKPYILRLFSYTVVLRSKLDLQYDRSWLMFL